MAWHNFVIFEGDESSVSVEMVHRSEAVTDPRQVDLYRDVYAKLWERAATGPDAVALLQRVAAGLRGQSVTSPGNAGEVNWRLGGVTREDKVPGSATPIR